MEPRIFDYVGEPAPGITTPEYADFIIHFQKSMLLSLVKQKLLTSAQMDCVMEKIENQYRKSKR